MSQNNKSSTLEKIKQLNPDGSGISDNIMIARLSRVLRETKSPENSLTSNSPDSPKDPNQQQKAFVELGQLLSQGNTEESQEVLKQKYFEHYLRKFGLEQEPQTSQDNQKVIAQLERFKELKSQLKLDSKQNVTSLKNQNQQAEGEKQAFIRTVLDTIITKGKDLGNQIRALYSSDRYTASLSVENSKQILKIDRNQPQPNQQNPAFQAQKQGLQDFKVLQNNLSDLEIQDIITDTQADTSQPIQESQPPQPIQPLPQRKPKNKAPELD